MRKTLAFAIIALFLTSGAMAQPQPVTPPTPPPQAVEDAAASGALTMVVVVVGGLIAVDWLSAGLLTAPITAVTGWTFPWVGSAPVVVIP
ncbi:MAG: hypothetical protein GC191_06135 [Azospirillum sp.]|nr:hypothetical protein [Azospirillum sp.]